MNKLISFGSRNILDPKQVNFLKADINYTYIFLNDGSKILSSTSIGVLETRLRSCKFLRPNRSLLINTNFIKSRNNGELILKNDEIIKVSRRRLKEITFIK
jgi:DNA-binding LytR/AlgR family response regulator